MSAANSAVQPGVYVDEPGAGSAASYSQTATICPHDIDFMGHVNNAIYLNWIQSAVIAHWRQIAGREAVAAHVWVAVRHDITYRKPSFLTDDILVNVTLEQVRRESAFYDTVITRQDEVLAQAKSRWCCLDAKTFRPARIDGEIAARVLASAWFTEPRSRVRPVNSEDQTCAPNADEATLPADADRG